MHAAPFAEAGLAACLLEDELDHGVGQSGVLLPGLSVVHDVVVAAFGEGEPGGHLIRPGDDLAVPGLQACLAGRLPGSFGLFAFAQVIVHAAEQQGQPPGGDQQLAVLGEGEPPAQHPGDVAEALLGAGLQLARRGCQDIPVLAGGSHDSRRGRQDPAS